MIRVFYTLKRSPVSNDRKIPSCFACSNIFERCRTVNTLPKGFTICQFPKTTICNLGRMRMRQFRLLKWLIPGGCERNKEPAPGLWTATAPRIEHKELELIAHTNKSTDELREDVFITASPLLSHIHNI